MEIRRTLGDKVRLYRRREGGAWHCSTYLKGKEWRRTTKEKSLARAKHVAEDWYFELCAKDRYGELKSGPTFAQAAKKFEEEYEAITHGRRSPKWVQGHKDRIRLHLMPYFGNKVLSEITSGVAQEWRHDSSPDNEENQCVAPACTSAAGSWCLEGAPRLVSRARARSCPLPGHRPGLTGTTGSPPKQALPCFLTARRHPWRVRAAAAPYEADDGRGITPHYRG